MSFSLSEEQRVELLNSFLRYVKIDTQSDPNSNKSPSTKKQFDLAKVLEVELRNLGLQDIHLSKQCYLTALIPANSSEFKEKIGLVAHLDTSTDAVGFGVNPQIIKNYSGKDITLEGPPKTVISLKENPGLKECKGHTIITTDGRTLLGADNKAGVAVIIAVAKHLLDNPEIPHGEIVLLFTPDEEIGQGTANIDLDRFCVDFAYTIDGELPGVINKETFSANSCFIKVNGREIHPGQAKDVMVNSLRVISEIISRLPLELSPERTENHEPFIHPHTLSATVGEAKLKLILRDFHDSGLDKQENIIRTIIADVVKLFPEATIECDIVESYKNMGPVVDEHKIAIVRLENAVKTCGIEPIWKPIRGGTDGSGLSAMGIPTPNIFTGGSAFHSEREWLSVEYMVKSCETVISLLSKGQNL